MVEVLAARVLLQCRDLDTSLDFYERGLGLSRFREYGEGSARGVVLFLGGGYLELKPAPPNRPPTVDGLRLWLQVPDLDAAAAELEDRGITLTAPSERKPWGLIEATVTDPDGLDLVLVEVPADHPLRRDRR